VVQARRASREKGIAFQAGHGMGFYESWDPDHHEMEANVGEFRVMSELCRGLGQLARTPPIVRGLVSWVGFSHTTLDYVRPERGRGDQVSAAQDAVHVSAERTDQLSPPRPCALPVCSSVRLAGRLALRRVTPSMSAFVLGARDGLAGDRQCLLLHIVSGVSGFRGRVRRRIFEEVKRRPLYLVRRKIDGAPTAAQESERR